MDKDTVQNIIATADNLHKDFDRALKRASTKSEVLKILNGLFGDSVVSEDLIKPWVSMPAYQKPRQLQREIQMNDSMTSA
ncbi:hypothetical protein [Oceanisphaera ostreae]|uniref:Transposase n=2 Tax=Oceanisphaera TaxID=225143 RepID=A0ABW3KKX8_9GAMM